MASTDIQRLIVSLEARTAAFEKAMNRANGVANKRARSIETRFARMNRQIGTSLGAAGKRWIAGLAAGLAAREIVQLSDAAVKIDNALKVAGLSGEELEKVYDRLFVSAKKNLAPFETLVNLYRGISITQKELNVTSEEMLNFTDKVALALRVSGKSATESRGALIQLTQAMGAGVVRAEEFNAILEGALPIAQAAARGLKEAGGSVAKMRKLVIDGKISSEAFFRAFEAGSVTLEDKVAGAAITVSQANENLKTSLINAVREFNNATGASESFAGGINSVSKAIDSLDIQGFIDKIAAAYDEFQRFSDLVGNAQVFEDLNNALGLTDGEGGVINLDKEEAESKVDALEREVELLQATIEKNTALGFDNTEALARISEVRQALAAAMNQASSLPEFISGIEQPVDIPGNANAVAGRAGGAVKRAAGATVKPVSIKDFKAPAKTGGGGRKRGRKGGNDFQREIAQIRERTAALLAETEAMSGLNPLIDDYGFAVEKARVALELETAARKAGLEITPELRAQIDELATSYANASMAAEQMADSQDQARESAEEMKSLGKEVLGGFISDLRAGKSGAEALAAALNKVLDKLIDIAINSVFSGGGFGGIFGKIFGFADGGIAKNGRPIKTFAKGGISNTAAIFGEGAGAEAAVPLPDGRRIPVDMRVPSGSGGAQVTITTNIDATGADAAQLVRVQQTVKELSENVPKMVEKQLRLTNLRNVRA